MCLRFCAQHSRAVLFTEREKKPNKTSRTRSLPRPRRPCPERIRSYTTLYHDRLLPLSSPTQHTDSSFRHIASGLSLYLSYDRLVYTRIRTAPCRRDEHIASIGTRQDRSTSATRSQQHTQTRPRHSPIEPLTNYYFSNDDTQRQVALYIKPGTSLIL
jgi:hypothetical protein